MNRIEHFFSTYQSEATIHNYSAMLKRYFLTFKFEGTLEEMAEKYFDEKRNYQEDIRVYFSSIMDRAPKSVTVCMSMLKTFLSENDVEFAQKFWRDLRRRKKGSAAITNDKIPTIDELKRITCQLPLNGRTLILLLASSGMRVGECLALKVEDVDLTKSPVTIYIRGENTKSGNSRFVFCSNEAKEYIQEWLKVKPAFLHKYHKQDDEKLFPFDYKTISTMWTNGLLKTGLAMQDVTTRYHILHLHVLRKFFRTQMALTVPVDAIEALMGHDGYLSSSYRRYSELQLAEFYRKGEASVTVSGSVVHENPELKALVSELSMDNGKLKLRMQELETLNLEMSELKRDFDNMQLGMRAIEKLQDLGQWPKFRIVEETP